MAIAATIMTTTNGCRPPSAASISLMSEKTMSLIHHHHIERLAVDALKPYAGNARTHSRKQVQQIATSISGSALPTRC